MEKKLENDMETGIMWALIGIMSCNLNSQGNIGGCIGVIKRDTSSLDYGSCVL